MKISGKLLERPYFPPLLDEIVGLHKHGNGIALVHGGGVQINKRTSEKLNTEPQFDKITGLRCTDLETMKIVVEVIEEINRNIVLEFCNLGLKNNVLGFGLESDLFHGKIINKCIGRYGRINVDKSNQVGVIEALKNGKIPIIAPIGKDNLGPLNLNADDAAVCLTELVSRYGFNVSKIVLLSDTDGLYVEGRRIEKICGICNLYLNELSENGIVTQGMKEKIYACMLAIEMDLSTPIIIANGTKENAIQNALDKNPYGTTITPPTK
ncbi:MAG: hypothetical protein AB1391_04525 [Candidatus Micrarchaeota archaeon]